MLFQKVGLYTTLGFGSILIAFITPYLISVFMAEIPCSAILLRLRMKQRYHWGFRFYWDCITSWEGLPTFSLNACMTWQVKLVEGLEAGAQQRGRLGPLPDGTLLTLHGDGIDLDPIWRHAGAS